MASAQCAVLVQQLAGERRLGADIGPRAGWDRGPDVVALVDVHRDAADLVADPFAAGPPETPAVPRWADRWREVLVAAAVVPA